MIIDLQKFAAAGRPTWTELERWLDRLEDKHRDRMTLDELQRFHRLYERTAADLARIATFSAEPETRRYLENLVARAYGEIHETREKRARIQPLTWFFQTFPQTFRKHARQFYLSVTITLIGCLFGGFAIAYDPGSKSVLLPFEHLQGDPAKRVAKEEAVARDELRGAKTGFSAFLMTHNTQVSVFTLGLGITWGVGTAIMLFYNGIILGAISVDYIHAGQTKFLLGWLLPHGVIEIPAILIAGQAGLVLALAMIGWGTRIPFGARLRKVSGDLMTLIFGVAIMLVWAGLVEAFFSQYHEPILPYELKIGFGVCELILLVLFLSKSGKKGSKFQVPSSGMDKGNLEAQTTRHLERETPN
ncbi:MAG: stage II sporulation protein M [Verrucomicrobia bacterium]|nr:stage II sporulation protein M [Verrucomicrobiota bacterium]